MSAWRTSRAVSGRPDARSDRAGDRARRSLSPASPARRPQTHGIEMSPNHSRARAGGQGQSARPPRFRESRRLGAFWLSVYGDLKVRCVRRSALAGLWLGPRLAHHPGWRKVRLLLLGSHAARITHPGTRRKLRLVPHARSPDVRRRRAITGLGRRDGSKRSSPRWVGESTSRLRTKAIGIRRRRAKPGAEVLLCSDAVIRRRLTAGGRSQRCLTRVVPCSRSVVGKFAGGDSRDRC